MSVSAAGAGSTVAGAAVSVAASRFGSGAGTADSGIAAAWSTAVTQAKGGGAAAASGTISGAVSGAVSGAADGGGTTRAVKDKGVPKQGKSAKKKARKAAAEAYARQTPEQRRQTTASLEAMYREAVGREATSDELAAAHRSLSRGRTWTRCARGWKRARRRPTGRWTSRSTPRRPTAGSRPTPSA